MKKLIPLAMLGLMAVASFTNSASAFSCNGPHCDIQAPQCTDTTHCDIQAPRCMTTHCDIQAPQCTTTHCDVQAPGCTGTHCDIQAPKN